MMNHAAVRNTTVKTTQWFIGRFKC